MSQNGVPYTRILDLDDYSVDLDNFNEDGLMEPGEWELFGDSENAQIDPLKNELQIGVPADGMRPRRELLGLEVFPGPYSDDTVTHLQTVQTMIAGPLVDDCLAVCADSVGSVPYAWCIAPESGTLEVPVAQPSWGGGRLHVMVSSGLESRRFSAPSSIGDATRQLEPFEQWGDWLELKGLKYGPFDLSPVSLEAANLNITADINGLGIQCLSGFSDWVRVSVVRHYNYTGAPGSEFKVGYNDCYSVAICEILTGTSTNLSGNTRDDSLQILRRDVRSVYEFEDVTVEEFLGAASSSDYEANPTGASESQATSWWVTAMGQQSDDLKGFELPEVDITDVGKPAASFAGATQGRALKLAFDRADKQGIFLSHRGISPKCYEPGDFITLAMNLYVDLDYTAGDIPADEINEASNGLTIAMGLTSEPFGTSNAVNYISVPPGEDSFAFSNPLLDIGQHAQINISGILHGKWTRHTVTYRVPEFGQSVAGGPSGAIAADLVDPGGISAKIAIGRGNTGLTTHQQTVWVDNITVSKDPGALNMTHGAIQCPMISAGWLVQWNGGQDSYGTIDGANDTALMPSALSRGEIVNGNFSTGDQGVAPVPESATPLFRIAENGHAGWVDDRDSTDVAFIGHGNQYVTLGFPIGFNDSAVLSSSLPDNYPSPSNDSGIPSTGFHGFVGLQTPFLDMRLADEATLPGLRVNDVSLEMRSGDTFSPNGIVGNISGVFGLRWFTRTNGNTPADNPQLSFVLSNADYTCGLVSQLPPQTLPNGADSICLATGSPLWLESQICGSVITFNSFRNYDLFTRLRTQNGSHDPTADAVQADNPGAQLAQISILRTNPGNQEDILLYGMESVPLNGYEGYLGEYTNYRNPPPEVVDAVPGRFGTATVFVDEVGLYAVRDITNFYDEDLCFFDLIPEDEGEPAWLE